MTGRERAYKSRVKALASQYRANVYSWITDRTSDIWAEPMSLRGTSSLPRGPRQTQAADCDHRLGPIRHLDRFKNRSDVVLYGRQGQIQLAAYCLVALARHHEP